MATPEALAFISIAVTIPGVLVAAIGVAFAMFAYIEWRKLQKLRADMGAMEKRLSERQYKAVKAAHKVIASYGAKDADTRIALLKDALSDYKEAYNAWNSLGYAWLEKRNMAEAKAAFMEAIALYPLEKAGYCDMAAAYLAENRPEAAEYWAKRAMEVDKSARDDMLADGRFAAIRASLRENNE